MNFALIRQFQHLCHDPPVYAAKRIRPTNLSPKHFFLISFSSICFLLIPFIFFSKYEKLTLSLVGERKTQSIFFFKTETLLHLFFEVSFFYTFVLQKMNIFTSSPH